MSTGITALCLTYGRFHSLQESLMSFLKQDSDYGQLLIWNFHAVPIRLAANYPRVTLLNEPHPGTNVELWAAALDKVTTPLVTCWMDDDLYLPWRLSQGVCALRNNKYDAAMPKGRYEYGRSTPKYFVFYVDDDDGANLTIRTEVARHAGLTDWPGIRVPANTVILPMIPRLPYLPSWVLSRVGEDGDTLKKSHNIPRDTQAAMNTVWRSRQTDTGKGELLAPVDIRGHWDLLRSMPGCPEIRALPASVFA